MLPERIGAIGGGNMGEAFLRGLIRAGAKPEKLLAADPDPARRSALERDLGVRTTASNADVASASELVLLAVKPDKLESAAQGLPREGGPLYLSVLAGRTLASLRRALGPRVARAMPNTPALIGAGVSALAVPADLSDTDARRAEAVLRAVGEVVRVPETALDAVTGLSGSGPAYVYLFIEALVDAGVREGLPAATARQLAAATAVGAARMVAESSDHPAQLRQRVTSPAGTTAAGLAALEQAGFRAALLAAVRAATARAKELSQDSA
jgi:pyrroline-5-carboxylate reductase